MRNLRSPVTLSIAFMVCASAQIITTVAGTDFTFPVRPVPAVNAPLGQMDRAALDAKGNLYVSDPNNSIVVRIAPDGTLTVVAGNGRYGFSGDGGAATAASLNFPAGIAIDSAGALYIADSGNQRIRKVSGGIITTIAGNGFQRFNGDGIKATDAQFNPQGVAVDSAGNLFIADRFNSRVRKISGGIISTVAGNGVAGYSGDNGPATSAQLNFPFDVAVDPAGNLYIADRRNSRIRKVSGGIITTVAGNGVADFTGDDGPATAASINTAYSARLDSAGNLYIADIGNNRIRKVANGIITTVVGNGVASFSGDGGPALSASINSPTSVVVDPAGNIFIVDDLNRRVRKVNAQTKILDTYAGNGLFHVSGDGGLAISATIDPNGVAVDSSGALYIADSGNFRVRRVTNGIISTFAGTGLDAFPQSSGPVATTPLDVVNGVAVDSKGVVYVANFRSVVRISGGAVTKIDGLEPTYFTIFSAVAVDSAGNLYVCDQGNHQVLKVAAAGGNVTRFAGRGRENTPSGGGFSGNGGAADKAELNFPNALAVDAAGNLYIADSGNSQIRKVDAQTGIITAFAGTGDFAFSGDAGLATSAALDTPSGLAIDAAGTVYIADTGNHRIRKVNQGFITTIAGNGVQGFSGDGGAPTSASFDTPTGLSVDAAGNIFIVDLNNFRIREIFKATVPFQVSPAALSFSAAAGGVKTGAQLVSLSSTLPGLAYTITTSVSWVNVTPAGGTIPASLAVTADPAQLTPGSYIATVTITAPNATPPTKTFIVTFAVTSAAPGKLAIGSANLSFALTTGASPSSLQVSIANQGGGSIGFTASASTASGGNWLQISATSGSVTAAAPVSLSVTATPGTLAAGTYSGSIAINSPDTGQQFVIPVTLALKEPLRKILLSQSGLTFTAVALGGAPLSQSFGILNVGQGSMDFTATATTFGRASGWLSIDAPSGTVATPFLDVSFVNVSVDPTGLSAGDYFGQVQVKSAGASNSPQTVAVILTVLPAGSNPAPELRPTGLVFTGVAGITPGSQDVRLANPSSQSTEYQSGIIGSGFTFAPANATIQPNQPAVVRVYPDFSKLSPGAILRGTITLQFSDGTPRTISVLTVVAPAARGPVAGRGAGGCAPANLLPVFAQLGSGFSVPAGFPATVIAKVVDDCGAPMTTGSVVASFSNGDPPLSLVSLQDGNWSSSWQPRNGAGGTVAVTLDARVPELNLKGTAQASIGLQGAKPLPVLSSGPLGAATLAEGPLAPGDLVLIRGSGLADGQGTASGSPGMQLAGASVIIGGRPAPLLYADNSQVLGLVPADLPANTSQQVLVQRDDNLGLPAPVIISATHPAILTKDASGRGQGVIYKRGALADASNPVQSGDTIVIYATGLGSTDDSGNTSVRTGVSIGGQAAQVSYAGAARQQDYPSSGAPLLLGGLVSASLGGLYQITATVPSGIPNGAAPVIVTVGGQSSQANVTVAAGSAAGGPPAITSINTAGGFPDIAQNAFIEIKGANLGPPSTALGVTWNGAPEFDVGRLPTQTAGVSVTVNGKPAFVYFVSPVQLNVLTPLDDTTGAVKVIVTTNGVSSAPFTTTLDVAAPSFLLAGATKYIVATHADGRLLVGPTSLSAPGFPFLPASPGETIVIYAVGFGLPGTALVNGSSAQFGSLPTLPVVQVGGLPAAVLFAGVIQPGLYQLNVTIPAGAPNGDLAVTCTYAGESTPSGALVTVQR